MKTPKARGTKARTGGSRVPQRPYLVRAKFPSAPVHATFCQLAQAWSPSLVNAAWSRSPLTAIGRANAPSRIRAPSKAVRCWRHAPDDAVVPPNRRGRCGLGYDALRWTHRTVSSPRATASNT